MPCTQCGARQTDPVRGASPWKRGVREGRHVLVCPECQQDPAAVAGLDRCPACGSASLVRMLGETTCRACGRFVPGPLPAALSSAETVTGALARPTEDRVPGLSAEVEAALERVLRRPVAL